DPGGYRVPRSLWLLPLATVGIPIVGIARQMLSDGALGVLLWLATWLVAAIVAVVLIRRSTWTVRGRLKGGAIAARVAYLYLLPAALFGPSGPRRVPPGDWRYAGAAGGGWQVLMPGTATPRGGLYGLQGDLVGVDHPKVELLFVAGVVTDLQ